MYFEAYHDRLNNRRVFACSDCYDQKDILKVNGFRWNSNAKTWEKHYKTPTELSRIIMTTMMICDCPFEVFDEMYNRPCNYDELATLEDLSVWDSEYYTEFCAKYELSSGDEDVSDEEQEFVPTISEGDAMELVIATGLRTTQGHGWFVKPETSAELIQKLNEHKLTLIRYMEGECFRRQAQVLRQSKGIEWVLLTVPVTADAPKAREIYAGTALEVDQWCKVNADDPLFADKCVSKYDIAWRAKETT